MKIEWSNKVTRLAHHKLNQRRMNKDQHLPLPDDLFQHLPLPDDLFKLSEYLKGKLQELNLDKEQANHKTFRKSQILSLTRLLVYNKRRSGELKAMT